MGTGWKRLGPASRDGDARGPQTGSVSTRRPSISIRTVEWPSQVARSPLAGGLPQASSGFIDGSGPRGTRRSPPQRNSPSVGIEAFGSRRPGITGCRLRKRSPAQRGEALMRSSRAPSGLLPNDFMCISLEGLTANDLEGDVDVAARGMRVGADLFVRFPGERDELGLRNALVLDAHLHREAETAGFARADRHGAGDLGVGGVALLPPCDEVERPAKAGRIACGEQMLRRGRARLARAAHFFGQRQVGLDDAVAGFRMTVAPADGGRGSGKERFDPIHSVCPFERFPLPCSMRRVCRPCQRTASRITVATARDYPKPARPYTCAKPPSTNNSVPVM